MKITLAFDIFNKEATIADVVRSWLNTLSGKHEVEVIAVFDALRDSSDLVVAMLMEHYPNIGYKALFTDDVFEIKADNAALKEATGDVIVFVQDDNEMHTQDWDDLYWRCIGKAAETEGMIGAVGLLAGVRFNRDFSLSRIECDRPHKGGNFAIHGIAPDTYPLAVYRVDVINRPFAVPRFLVGMGYGGLDEAYCPMDWDDADLSLKLLRDGFTNLYIPFDVVNTCAKKSTLSQGQIVSNYQHGERIARERWAQFVAERESSVRMLWTLTEDADGRLSL